MIVWGLRSQINNTYCSSFRFENNWEIHWSFTLTITFVSNETDWRKWFSTCNFARYLDTSKTCLQAKALQDCFRLLPKGRQETQIQALCGSQNEENKKQREENIVAQFFLPNLGYSLLEEWMKCGERNWTFYTPWSPSTWKQKVGYGGFPLTCVLHISYLNIGETPSVTTSTKIKVVSGFYF